VSLCRRNTHHDHFGLDGGILPSTSDRRRGATTWAVDELVVFTATRSNANYWKRTASASLFIVVGVATTSQEKMSCTQWLKMKIHAGCCYGI